MEGLGVTDLRPVGSSSRRRRTLAPRLRPLWSSTTLGSQAIRFAAVGAFNTVFSFGVFAAVQSGLDGRIHYLVALVIAHVAGILEAYILQRWLVYQVRGRWWPDLIRFSSVYAVVLVVLLAGLTALSGKRAVLMAGTVLVLAAAGFGAFVAARQSWLQWYPPEVASCGRDFYGMIETFPLKRAIPMIFKGSGDCAKIDWTFLGGSLANWSFVMFSIGIVVALLLLVRLARARSLRASPA